MQGWRCKGVEEPLRASFQHQGLAPSHRAMQAVMDAASTDPRAAFCLHFFLP